MENQSSENKLNIFQKIDTINEGQYTQGYEVGQTSGKKNIFDNPTSSNIDSSKSI